MPLNAFIVRPFGVKDIIVRAAHMPAELKPEELKASNRKLAGSEVITTFPTQVCESTDWKVSINFDVVHERLVTKALKRLNIHGQAASAIVVAGNIREDMFHRLITSDLVIADLSIHNANVFYELGIRQAFRDKYTFLIRSNLSDYPFDLQTDRYFSYNISDLFDDSDKIAEQLADALRGTIMSYKADSPVFKLLPKLEAEDRSRFISVPHEFHEEVERAQYLRLPEQLRLLAVECENTLWEVEGLREVGRAQFESNLIDDAKATWEQIVSRYPDDIEANTILSTVYQRRNDAKRSNQALERISRVASMTANRQSQLRSLNGRNLREEWTKRWFDETGMEQRQTAALKSPLLQRAYEAFEDAFKRDLNNTYAGLNALTLFLIQTELAHKLPKVWASIQRDREGITDLEADFQRRNQRIEQFIATLELAVESDRERLRREGTVDPWFSLLEASVACIVSDKPEYVAQLYEDARHFAPVDSERSMYRALEIYDRLGITGREVESKASRRRPTGTRTATGCHTVGTIARNLKLALEVMKYARDDIKKPGKPRRIVMFAGLRIDITPSSDELRRGFPEEHCDEVEQLIKETILREQGSTDGVEDTKGTVVFGIAAGAHGGDLLFHKVCKDLKIPTRMCLALPRGEYIGRYVAPAGPHWVEEFSALYQNIIDEERRRKPEDKQENGETWAIRCLSDSNELPRWLQGRPYYNVGRRNNLWMLQHAIVAANQLGENTEITLITFYDGKSELGMGGIGHLIEQAKMAGIKVRKLRLPHWQEARPSVVTDPVVTVGDGSDTKPPTMPLTTPPQTALGHPPATPGDAGEISH